MTLKRICRILSGEWLRNPWRTSTVPSTRHADPEEIVVKFTICDDDDEDEQHGINPHPPSVEYDTFDRIKYGIGKR